MIQLLHAREASSEASQWGVQGSLCRLFLLGHFSRHLGASSASPPVSRSMVSVCRPMKQKTLVDWPAAGHIAYLDTTQHAFVAAAGLLRCSKC